MISVFYSYSSSPTSIAVKMMGYPAGLYNVTLLANKQTPPFDLFEVITQSVSPVTCWNSDKANRSTATPTEQIRFSLQAGGHSNL